MTALYQRRRHTEARWDERHRPRARAGVSWGTLAASAFAALIVGLVFGTYPAMRAARLSPIDAIQRD